MPIICSHDTEEDKSWAGERLDSWNKLSQPAKEQFFWPQPGVNYTGLQEASSGEGETPCSYPQRPKVLLF